MNLGINIGIQIGGSSARESFPPILNDGNTWVWVNKDNVIESGGYVSQMTDLSGQDNHLLQADVNKQPTVTATGILFDGVDDLVTAIPFTDIPVPVTHYVVVKRIGNIGIMVCGKFITAQQLSIVSSPVGEMYIRNATLLYNDTQLNMGQYDIMRLVYDGATSSFQVNDLTPEVGDTALQPWGGMSLGCDPAATYHSNVEFKEVIGRKGLDSAQTQSEIYEYLKEKHGL